MGQSMGHVPYIYTNLQKLQCTMLLHIYSKQWKTGSYT